MGQDRINKAGAVLGFVMLAAAIGPLGAAQQASVVGIIDNEKVFNESAPGRSAAQQIDANFASWQSQITQAEEELSGMVAQRNQQASVMAPASLRQLDAEIEQKQIDLQRLRDDAERQFAQIRNRILANLEAALTPQVEELAREMGFATVFNSQTPGLVYYDEGADITDALIARLNASAQ